MIDNPFNFQYPFIMNKIKIRKTWGDFNPVSRIHNGNGKQGHKPKYSKNDRKSWKKEVGY